MQLLIDRQGLKPLGRVAAAGDDRRGHVAAEAQALAPLPSEHLKRQRPAVALLAGAATGGEAPDVRNHLEAGIFSVRWPFLRRNISRKIVGKPWKIDGFASISRHFDGCACRFGISEKI